MGQILTHRETEWDRHSQRMTLTDTGHTKGSDSSVRLYVWKRTVSSFMYVEFEFPDTLSTIPDITRKLTTNQTLTHRNTETLENPERHRSRYTLWHTEWHTAAIETAIIHQCCGLLHYYRTMCFDRTDWPIVPPDGRVFIYMRFYLYVVYVMCVFVVFICERNLLVLRSSTIMRKRATNHFLAYSCLLLGWVGVWGVSVFMC